jgi:hypothetical protein
MDTIRLFFAPTMDGSSPVLPFMAKAPSYFDFSNLVFVQHVAEADFVVIPYTPRHLTPEFVAYAQKTVSWAKEQGKQTVAFLAGDYAYKNHIEGAIVFKASAFKHSMRLGEVISPSLADDPYYGKEFIPHDKHARPVVSFCGFADMPSLLTRIKYALTNVALDVAALLTRKKFLTAHKRGIYYRRTAMKLLGADSRIETRFIVRKTFFGQAPEAETVQHRQEYLDNMAQADFALAPRGDGNYSRRFFRALSMGAIPILIDTDMVLPLEKELDYSKFIVRVPHTELHTLPDRVVELYNSLSNDEFRAMQQAARDAYLNYLRQDKFYSRAFALLKAHGPQAL